MEGREVPASLVPITLRVDVFSRVETVPFSRVAEGRRPVVVPDTELPGRRPAVVPETALPGLRLPDVEPDAVGRRSPTFTRPELGRRFAL